MLKMIASDMDGTLLNEKILISKTNAQAILKAQQKGIHFLVATGRGYQQAASLLEEAGISCPIIALNGAQMFDKEGKLLFSRGIEKDHVRETLSMIKESGAHGEIMTTHGIFSDSREKRLEALAYMEMEINPSLSYDEAFQYSHNRLKDLDISFVDNYERILQQDEIAILKISAFHQDGTSLLVPLKETIESKYKNLVITSSNFSNIEINHESAQKGIALKEYAEKLDVPAEKVMAIGDNLNDVSMLRWAGLSFAVENARKEAKQAARYETSTNVENGVAEAIARLLQKQPENQSPVENSIDK